MMAGVQCRKTLCTVVVLHIYITSMHLADTFIQSYLQEENYECLQLASKLTCNVICKIPDLDP